MISLTVVTKDSNSSTGEAEALDCQELEISLY